MRLQQYRETAGKDWLPLKNKYRGERCFIIGNGPSLNKQDLRPLADEFTIVANEFILHEDFSTIDPDLYCICSEKLFGSKDDKWLQPEEMVFDSFVYDQWMSKPNTMTWVFPYHYKPAFDKQGIFPEDEVRYVYFEPPWKLVQSTKQMNMDVAAQPMHNGRTVLLNMAIPIAYYLGFSEVYLVGCDCNYYRETWEEQAQHFYEREPCRDFVERTPVEFKQFQKRWGSDGYVIHNYEVVKEQFEKGGRVVYNATEGGSLEMFPKVALNSVLKGDEDTEEVFDMNEEEMFEFDIKQEEEIENV